MSKSYYYSLGPFISRVEGDGGRCWSAPDGVVGLIDVAGNEDFTILINADRNIGFFASTQPLGSAYATLNPGSPGDLRELKSTGTMRDAWRGATGFDPQGETLVDLLNDHLTRGADPDGDEQCRPLIPTSAGILEIHLGGHSLVHSRKFQGQADPHWNKYQTVIKRELKEVHDAAKSGNIISAKTKRVDPDYHRKIADAMMVKLARCGVNDFEAIRPKGWDKRETPLKHDTVISESWPTEQTSITTNQDLPWAEVRNSGDLQVNASNQLFSAIGAPENLTYARAETDLSSSDHYAQILHVSAVTASYIGPCVRFDSSDSTFYCARNRPSVTVNQIAKFVTGSRTNLFGAATPAYAAGKIVYLSADGSTITQNFDGGLVQAGTDTSITGGTRCGVWARANLNDLAGEFEAGDLFVVAPAAFHHRQLMAAH